MTRRGLQILPSEQLLPEDNTTTNHMLQWSGTAWVDANIIAPATNVLTLTNAAASTLALNITAAKTLTLTAADDYTLTIPATGTATLGTGTANYVTYWSGTNTLTGAATFQYQTAATDNLLVQAANAAHVAAVFKGAVSQTDNIWETQKSDGTVLSGADSRGVLFSNAGIDTGSVFIGDSAGNTTYSGTRNVGIGYQALSSLTSGTQNVSLGYQALSALQGGSSNFGLGYQALLRVTSGGNNICIGTSSGSFIVTGDSNNAIGQQAYLNGTGDFNQVFGRQAMRYVQGGNWNVAIGHQAGEGNSGLNSCSNNVFVGGRAGQANTTGSSNIYIGYQSAINQTTGSGQLIIDNQSRASAAIELTNSILYGVMAATPASQTLRINAFETVAVNTTTTNAALTVLDLNAYVSTASTGFAAGGGVGMTFTAETATDGTSQIVAKIAGTFSDPINAQFKGDLDFYVKDSSAERQALKLSATGSDVTLLAYGKLAFTQTDLNEYIDSLADGYMDYRATTAHRFGDGTNYLNITGSGLTSFVGTAGLYAGHMYTNATITVTISDSNPTEIGDTWTTGEVNGVSFGSAHYLDVGANGAGKYAVIWAADVAQNSPSAAIILEMGIMVNGSAQAQGKVTRNVANSTDIGAVASTAILDLAANAQVSLYVANLTNTTNIDVDNANVTIVQIIGT